MSNKIIKVDGVSIRIEGIDQDEFISLTDIAKRSTDALPKNIIQNWMKNSNTIRFLHTWESIHNTSFKGIHLDAFLKDATDNKVILSPSKWIKQTNAKGIRSKAGKNGGTYAHSEIALNFCYWLSPEFQVYVWKEFKRLKEEDSERRNIEWHISKLTDNVDEMRNLLDTIPGQKNNRNRLNKASEEKDS